MARRAQPHSCNAQGIFRLSEVEPLTSLDAVTQSRTARARRKTGGPQPPAVHPIGTPTNGVSPNTGPLATAAWLAARGLIPSEARWYAEILVGTSADTLDEEESTLLRIELFSEEWGYCFRHGGKVSWIRVTDVPFMHGRDEHSLLGDTRALTGFGTLVRAIESRFGISFDPRSAVIQTNLFGADGAIREWIETW